MQRQYLNDVKTIYSCEKKKAETILLIMEREASLAADRSWTTEAHN